MKQEDFRYICRLNTKILKSEFGDLSTDELILTAERDEHIKVRHAADYTLFQKNIGDVVRIPDLILKDSKNINTVFYIKYIEEIHLNVVVRLSLQTENSKLKNSIITSYRIREKNLKRLKKNLKTLYKNE